MFGLKFGAKTFSSVLARSLVKVSMRSGPGLNVGAQTVIKLAEEPWIVSLNAEYENEPTIMLRHSGAITAPVLDYGMGWRFDPSNEDAQFGFGGNYEREGAGTLALCSDTVGMVVLMIQGGFADMACVDLSTGKMMNHAGVSSAIYIRKWSLMVRDGSPNEGERQMLSWTAQPRG